MQDPQMMPMKFPELKSSDKIAKKDNGRNHKTTKQKDNILDIVILLIPNTKYESS